MIHHRSSRVFGTTNDQRDIPNFIRNPRRSIRLVQTNRLPPNQTSNPFSRAGLYAIPRITVNGRNGANATPLTCSELRQTAISVGCTRIHRESRPLTKTFRSTWPRKRLIIGYTRVPVIPRWCIIGEQLYGKLRGVGA